VAGFRIRTAAHGVTTKATSSEKTIAALAPIGWPHVGAHQPADESHRQYRVIHQDANREIRANRVIRFRV